jgi:hypothetical protein
MAEEPVHRVTRQALFDAVWSEPMSKLAPRFGVSDVALAKACQRAGIPRPDQGFWARRRKGSREVIPRLPPRPLGIPDEIVLGRARGGYVEDRLTDAEILGPVPPPPMFGEDLDTVRARARAMVGRVPAKVPGIYKLVSRLQEEDQKRREEQLRSRYPVWDKPRFDSAIERRRLRVLNALAMTLGRCGCAVDMRDRDGRELGVRVGHQHVGVLLDRITAKGGRKPAKEGEPERLRCQIEFRTREDEECPSWEDSEAGGLETQLAVIATEILTTGERQLRALVQHVYDWRIERKRDLEERLRQAQLEQERKERERKAALQRARVDRLLSEAEGLRRARDIRSYVAEVRAEIERGAVLVDQGAVESWERWALAQADEIDPVRTGAFLDARE